MPFLESLTRGLTIMLLLLASLEDLKRRRVSHGYWIALIGVGLLTPTELWHSLLVAGLTFFILFLLSLYVKFPGGDAKLLTALAFIYPHQSWTILLMSGLLFLAQLLIMKGLHRKGTDAFAPFILLGLLFSV